MIDEFRFEIGAEGSGYLIVIPYGFITDFASVPRFLWSWFPPWEDKASVLHDYLYKKASGFSKLMADTIYLEAMRIQEDPSWKCWAKYYAVRLFGKSSYNWEQPGA